MFVIILISYEKKTKIPPPAFRPSLTISTFSLGLQTLGPPKRRTLTGTLLILGLSSDLLSTAARKSALIFHCDFIIPNIITVSGLVIALIVQLTMLWKRTAFQRPIRIEERRRVLGRGASRVELIKRNLLNEDILNNLEATAMACMQI